MCAPPTKSNLCQLLACEGKIFFLFPIHSHLFRVREGYLHFLFFTSYWRRAGNRRIRGALSRNFEAKNRFPLTWFCVGDFHLEQIISPNYLFWSEGRGCNSVVECPLRMRKVPGSNPGSSTIPFPFFIDAQRAIEVQFEARKQAREIDILRNLIYSWLFLETKYENYGT